VRSRYRGRRFMSETRCSPNIETTCCGGTQSSQRLYSPLQRTVRLRGQAWARRLQTVWNGPCPSEAVWPRPAPATLIAHPFFANSEWFFTPRTPRCAAIESTDASSCAPGLRHCRMQPRFAAAICGDIFKSRRSRVASQQIPSINFSSATVAR